VNPAVPLAVCLMRRVALFQPHRRRDGRISSGAPTVSAAAPAQMPNTGASTWRVLAATLLDVCLIALGWQVRRRGRA